MLENYIIGYGLQPSQAKLIMLLIEEIKQQNIIINDESEKND